MILKVRDEQDFNISMNLNINYELEYIELTVLRTLMRFAKLSERPVCRPGHISPAEKCWW